MLGDEHVSLGACELTLQRRKRRDELGGPERTVAARRPTATCVRIPAPTSWSIAWFVAWKDRLIRSDAVVTVSRGTPGNARTSRSTADPRRTAPSRSPQESWSGGDSLNWWAVRMSSVNRRCWTRSAMGSLGDALAGC